MFILFGLPFGIYACTFEGFKAIVGPITLFFVFVAFLLVLIDRKFSKFTSIIKLNLIELILIVIAVIFYVNSNTSLTVNITNPKIEYLLVIENSGKFTNDKLQNSFPTNRRIDTEKNYVIVDKMSDEVGYTTSADWDGNFYYHTYEFEKYRSVELFSKNKMNIDQEFIDSLISVK